MEPWTVLKIQLLCSFKAAVKCMKRGGFGLDTIRYFLLQRGGHGGGGHGWGGGRSCHWTCLSKFPPLNGQIGDDTEFSVRLCDITWHQKSVTVRDLWLSIYFKLPPYENIYSNCIRAGNYKVSALSSMCHIMTEPTVVTTESWSSIVSGSGCQDAFWTWLLWQVVEISDFYCKLNILKI